MIVELDETDKQPLPKHYFYVLGCAVPLIIVGALFVAGKIVPDRMYEAETPVTRIANYGEWLEKRGSTWLDFEMPKSVLDFCEVHDMDSNDIYSRFFIAPEDIDQLGKSYTEIVQHDTPTWPPATRIFIREYFECDGCKPTQHRLVVDVKSGLVEFNPDSSDWLKGRCSAL